MKTRTTKSSTDLHWDKRAREEQDPTRVNISDLPQRQCENQFLFGALEPQDRVLEVGCGNGYLTNELRRHVAGVDAFDFSESMIDAAKEQFGQRNGRFFVDSVLDAHHVEPPYDAVVCVRVLINLANTAEQILAVRNMAKWLKPAGRLVLLEGFLDGFEALNELRSRCGMTPIAPAPINHYCRWGELEPTVTDLFDIGAEWRSGMFDLLTRVVYPLVVGPARAQGPSDFHDKVLPLALTLNPACLGQYGRVRGYVLKRK